MKALDRRRGLINRRARALERLQLALRPGRAGRRLAQCLRKVLIGHATGARGFLRQLTHLGAEALHLRLGDRDGGVEAGHVAAEADC